MTREEAINELAKYTVFIPAKEVLTEVFDMAIEALSAESTGELISKADAIALLTKIVFDEPPYFDSETLCKKYAEEQINMLPSADTVEIVRCKDCKHYSSDGGALMICEVSEMNTNDNDFCSLGEREQNEKK